MTFRNVFRVITSVNLKHDNIFELISLISKYEIKVCSFLTNNVSVILNEYNLMRISLTHLQIICSENIISSSKSM